MSQTQKFTFWTVMGLAFLMGALIGWEIFFSQPDRKPIFQLEHLMSLPVDVQHIIVLSGHEYDLKLADGRRIKGVLEVVTPIEATEKVVRFLNTVTKPKVVLLSQMPTGPWIIRLYVNSNGETVEMVSWLKAQKLVWN